MPHFGPGAQVDSTVISMPTSADFRTVGEVATDVDRASIYIEGWQSWSPAGLYSATARPPSPLTTRELTMGWRASSPPPANAFQGEGLLAVVGADGAVSAWAGDLSIEVPSIRASLDRTRIVISADGPVENLADRGGLSATLSSWADRIAKRFDVVIRPIPTGWCSWYFYFRTVTEPDVRENLESVDRLELPVEMLEVDDGWQAGIGDWLRTDARFGSLERVARRIAESGRMAGVWSAPFLVGEHSELASAHPNWLVGEVDAGWNWHQRLAVLDVTHPDAAKYLADVYAKLAENFRFFKLDFIYAGALPGQRHRAVSPIEAYREGLRIIRQAVGQNAVLLGSGAPLLPSIGLVDSMRIGPDVLAESDERGGTNAGDVENLVTVSEARSWMHGTFWTNDPDCLIARPEYPHREHWAAHISELGGAAVSGDRLRALDQRGLELTRQILRAT